MCYIGGQGLRKVNYTRKCTLAHSIHLNSWAGIFQSIMLRQYDDDDSHDSLPMIIAWRVLIALEEKKIDYRSVCVSFSSGVLKGTVFQQLNPRMKVPVFVDGTAGIVLYECSAILAYLEQFFPHPLMPISDPKSFGIAQTRLHESNEVLSIVGEMVVYLRRMAQAQKNHPQANTIMKNPKIDSVLQAKWAGLESELKLWEQYLSDNLYVAGNEMYLCDIVVFTNIAYAVRCGLQLDGLYPRLAMFYLRMCARPSIEKTYE